MKTISIFDDHIWIDVIRNTDKDIIFSDFLKLLGYKEVKDDSYTPIGWKHEMIRTLTFY